MSKESEVLLEAQYHCRGIQVEKIIGEVESMVRAEQGNLDYSLLSRGLNTPPLLLPDMLRSCGLDTEGFFESIKPVVINSGKFGKTLAILDSLRTACSPNKKGLREMSVDSVDARLPEIYQALYRGRMDELENINAQCLNQASITVMKHLEGATPLFKYRKDLAQTYLRLVLGFSGAEIASIPTRIPNVDLQLTYPRGVNFPHASLLVKPFS